MKEYLVKRPLKRPPVHPGEILREDVLKSLSWLALSLLKSG
jgi:plasmid maintenance system antidote protein VapI